MTNTRLSSFRGRPDQWHPGFHLVHFTVAAEHPDLAVFGVGNATGVQVLQEAGLVDGHQRAQAHRHRGELPELGHQFGVRVARQALAVHFLAEVEQLLFGQATFQVGAGIHAGRHVALDVQAVAAVVFALGVPEVVEAGAKQAGQRGKRTDVATQVTTIGRVMAVGLDHHGHGVPAHVGAQALFDFQIAGRALFLRRPRWCSHTRVAENGMSMLLWRACSSNCSSRKCARSGLHSE
jgi:hypothetical protein